MNSININLHGYYINNTYLHNFDLYDMGNFWTKMCQFDTFFYYTPSDISDLNNLYLLSNLIR